MFREGTIIDKQDTEKLVVSLRNEEPFKVKMKGECTDRIFKNGVLIEERVGHNLVVTSFLNLISYALKNSNGGIKYWAVGQGASSWDSNSIFGGDASSTANSGIMMNKRHHAVITKTSDMTIERVMKFTLGLS